VGDLIAIEIARREPLTLPIADAIGPLPLPQGERGFYFAFLKEKEPRLFRADGDGLCRLLHGGPLAGAQRHRRRQPAARRSDRDGFHALSRL